LTRSIHAPGFGAEGPAPAIGRGSAMPTPSMKGSARPPNTAAN
jgi:hypothetical protein